MHSRRAPFLVALAAAAAASALPAQTALVRDIRSGPHVNPGSNAADFAELGTHVYFAARRPDVGLELFRTRGTPATTELFADLAAGTADGAPAELTAAGASLYFVAGPARSLWVTDGTPGGTRALAGPGRPSSLRAFGNLVVFQASDGAGTELWRSDGTPAGTARIVDLNAGPASSNPVPLGVHQGFVYFAADDGQLGIELWRSDGTAAGTSLVCDTLPGAGNGYPSSFAGIGNDVWFGSLSGFVPTVWKSDGTPPGSVALRRFPNFFFRGVPYGFTPLGGIVLFVGPDAATGLELWRSDGTPAGTSLVLDIEPGAVGSNPSGLIATGGVVVFGASDARGHELWRSDGTAAGTMLVRDLALGSASSTPLYQTAFGTDVFFVADDGVNGRELWRSDGTLAGTVLVRDVRPGPAGSSLGALAVAPAAGLLYFAADDGSTGFEPWLTDGTAGNTRLVADLSPPAPGTPGSFPDLLVDLYGTLLFTADDGVHGRELWRSDGTAAGTALVSDLVPGPTGLAPVELTVAGRFCFFLNGARTELWRTDGTAAGTVLVRAVPTTATSLRAAGQTLVFTAFEPATGLEPWRSDGTAAGTGPLADIAPGAADSMPRLLGNAGRTLLFTADDGVHGRELWCTDGTAAGTALCADVQPGSGDGTYQTYEVAAFGGRAWFAADDGVRGIELWSTDGTPGGTVLFADLWPGAESSWPRTLTPAGDRMFFTAYSAAAGEELYVTDGTAAGTRLVADVMPGPAGSGIDELAAVGNAVVFDADDGSGSEPWWSDGTTAGTRRITDVEPGGGSLARAFASSGSRNAWFAAFSALHGWRLWRTDGTAGGTRAVFTGTGAVLERPVASGGALYFRADDGVHGSELWRAEVGATSQPVGTGCGAGLRSPSLAITDPVPGSVLAFTGRDAPLGFGFLLLSARIVPPWTLNGCAFHLGADLQALLLLQPQAGSWSAALLLPDTPALHGIGFAIQAVFATPSGALEATHAVAARCGV